MSDVAPERPTLPVPDAESLAIYISGLEHHVEAVRDEANHLRVVAREASDARDAALAVAAEYRAALEEDRTILHDDIARQVSRMPEDRQRFYLDCPPLQRYEQLLHGDPESRGTAALEVLKAVGRLARCQRELETAPHDPSLPPYAWEGVREEKETALAEAQSDLLDAYRAFRQIWWTNAQLAWDSQ